MKGYREIDVVLAQDETIKQAMTNLIKETNAKINWLAINEAGPIASVLIVGTSWEMTRFCNWVNTLNAFTR